MLQQVKSSDQFELLINNTQIVFVDFWAEWCKPCLSFGEVYERVANQHEAIQFAQVNIEEMVELAEIFQIRSIPHLMIFKQGIAIYSEAGTIPESALKELVQQAINIDVSELRAKIDEGEV